MQVGVLPTPSDSGMYQCCLYPGYGGRPLLLNPTLMARGEFGIFDPRAGDPRAGDPRAGDPRAGDP